MSSLEPAQLDNVCPHPIKNKELLKWASPKELEKDFASLREKVNQLDTRVEMGSKAFKKLEETSSELSDIFVIPKRAGKTAKDIINIRLCAYIRLLEFILRKIVSTSDSSIWTRFLSLLEDKVPSIIESFRDAEDTPDVQWFFKNRVMPFLLRESLIHHSNHHDECSSKLHLYLSQFTFLDNHDLYIDADDCDIIMKHLLFPELEDTEKKYHNCADCDEIDTKIYRNDWKQCRYLAAMESLVDRHKSMLQKSIEFSMDQFYQPSQRDQAKRFLYILLRVAYDRKRWKVIKATLGHLSSDTTAEIRAYAARLITRLVRLDKCGDSTSFGIFLEHFDIMLELLKSPSSEFRELNHHIWMRLATSNQLKPEEYQEVVNIYLKRLDESGPLEPGPQNKIKEYITLSWLIMPKAKNRTGDFNFTSASNKLFEDLNLIMNKETISGSFYWHFRSVCREFCSSSLRNDKSRNQFDLICDRASWHIVRQISSSKLGNSRDLELLLCSVTANIYGWRRWQLPECMPPASYLDYCGILLEIHQHFYDPKQILGLQSCLWFLRVLEQVGPSQYNEEKLRAMDSCLLRAIELHPRRRWQFFKQTFQLVDSTDPTPLPHSALRLAYHENGLGRIMSNSRGNQRGKYPPWNDIQGIQSRRMFVVSLCKYLIAGLNYTAISEMIDLLSELELAYKLRTEQEYSEIDKYLSLLPSCVELAFPTPFDDPNNAMYICEFAYFRDTINYLQRNKPEQLDRICSKLSGDKRKRLEYYQNDYDNFGVSCWTRKLNKERDRFRCIDHKIDDQEEIRICPLLNRYQYCEYIKY